MDLHLAAKIDLARTPETEDERLAVRQLKVALNRLGFYTPDPTTGMTGDIDAGLKDSVYAYQRKATIFFDDVWLGPGATTERILNEDLERAGDDGKYIWRTVGDGKVRGEHARRAGQTFSWANPPDGENPGEDYNCRCWAEPVAKPYHPWIDWVNERQQQRLAQSSVVEKLAPLKGLNTGQIDELPKEKTNSAVPVLTLFAALLLFRAGKLGLPVLRVFLSRSSKNAYEIALEGGRHSGTLKKYRTVSNRELDKSIKSFDKQINRHLEKIKNPEKEYPDFKNLDERRQKSLLEKKWLSDIKRLEEEREIMRRILDERN